MPIPPATKLHVIVAGGGVAALEATLALHHLAPDHTRVTVLTEAETFRLPPLAVRDPFSVGHAAGRPIAPLLDDLGSDLIAEELASVDSAGQTVTTTGGQMLAYDALLIACGGRAAARFEHAMTIENATLGELLRTTMDAVGQGLVERIVFLAPPRMAWPLALYDLALMTAQRAADAGMRLAVTIVTPEDRPLEIFGDVASAGVTGLLDELGIEVRTNAHATVPVPGLVAIGEARLQADAIIALPELFGRAILGLPLNECGFVPVDAFGRVPHCGQVYAAGDCADYPVKLGGIAAQMADTAARAIAAHAGAPVTATPLDPMLRGMLLTGRSPSYLYAHRVGDHAFDSEFSSTPLWNPPSKISSLYLAPYLAQGDHAAAA